MSGLVTILAAALLLAACGGGGTTSPATTAKSSSSSGYGSSSSSSASGSGTSASGSQSTSGAAAVALGHNAKLGAILVDAKGMTLYTFKSDSPGKSTCNGTCATRWPPLAAPAGGTAAAAKGITGKLTVITRSDGSKQIACNGMPLYLFAGDKAAGDAKGQGLLGKWYVVGAGCTPVTKS